METTFDEKEVIEVIEETKVIFNQALVMLEDYINMHGNEVDDFKLKTFKETLNKVENL